MVSLSTPVTGTNKDSPPLEMVPITAYQNPAVHRTTPQPPPTDFPRFDGENPRLWQKSAEKYFRLFAVEPGDRVEYATMHFTGNAALWLQSVEDRLPAFTWETLCELLGKHFDRGKIPVVVPSIVSIAPN